MVETSRQAGQLQTYKNLEIMTNEERIQMVIEAKEMVEQAMLMVNEAVADTPEKAHYEAYERYGFAQLLGNGNPHDSGLHTLIDELAK